MAWRDRTPRAFHATAEKAWPWDTGRMVIREEKMVISTDWMPLTARLWGMMISTQTHSRSAKVGSEELSFARTPDSWEAVAET